MTAAADAAVKHAVGLIVFTACRRLHVALRHAVVRIRKRAPTHYDAQRCNASLFDSMGESCNVSNQQKSQGMDRAEAA
jgi:hypothetical protein